MKGSPDFQYFLQLNATTEPTSPVALDFIDNFIESL
jgi:hypothetical protein